MSAPSEENPDECKIRFFVLVHLPACFVACLEWLAGVGLFLGREDAQISQADCAQTKSIISYVEKNTSKGAKV